MPYVCFSFELLKRVLKLVFPSTNWARSLASPSFLVTVFYMSAVKLSLECSASSIALISEISPFTQ